MIAYAHALGLIRDFAMIHLGDTRLLAVWEMATVALHPEANFTAHVEKLRRDMPDLFVKEKK